MTSPDLGDLIKGIFIDIVSVGWKGKSVSFWQRGIRIRSGVLVSSFFPEKGQGQDLTQ